MSEIWKETIFQWNDWRNCFPLWICCIAVPLIAVGFCWNKMWGKPLYDN